MGCPVLHTRPPHYCHYYHHCYTFWTCHLWFFFTAAQLRVSSLLHSRHGLLKPCTFPWKGLSLGLALGQLLGDELLSPCNILSDKTAYGCLRPWTAQYQFDKIIYGSNIVHSECLFFFLGLCFECLESVIGLLLSVWPNISKYPGHQSSGKLLWQTTVYMCCPTA